MIVTRQRKKAFPWKRLILPIVAIALVLFAFVWPPSRGVITNGPMAPVWGVVGNVFANISKPFSFAAQNEALTQKNKQIVDLQKQVADLQGQVTTKDNKIKDLGGQLQQAQLAIANPKASASAAPSQNAAATADQSGAAATPAGGDLTQGATADMRRTAAYWGNMEPANAAKLVQKLPVPYVARVLALMGPDTVGAILDALPPDYAAKLTQDHPELKK